jgi:hypothetical protein
MDWQANRTMTPDEYLVTLHKLGLSAAAAGRYLGVSARTSRRYANGEADVPEAVVLLLRALLAYRVRPIVPAWTAAWEARQ